MINSIDRAADAPSDDRGVSERFARGRHPVVGVVARSNIRITTTRSHHLLSVQGMKASILMYVSITSWY